MRRKFARTIFGVCGLGNAFHRIRVHLLAHHLAIPILGQWHGTGPPSAGLRRGPGRGWSGHCRMETIPYTYAQMQPPPSRKHPFVKPSVFAQKKGGTFVC